MFHQRCQSLVFPAVRLSLFAVVLLKPPYTSISAAAALVDDSNTNDSMSKLDPNQLLSEPKHWRFPDHTNMVNQPIVVVNNHFADTLPELGEALAAAGASTVASALSSLAPDGGAGKDGDTVLRVGDLNLSATNLCYAGVILVIAVLLIVTSITIITTIWNSETLKDVIGYYLISLSVTDLFCGVLVLPLAFYAALNDDWAYGLPTKADGGGTRWICKIESYLSVMLWATHVYMFMWIAVDRYAAVHKPARYEVEQTFTRCKCWIGFTWITGLLLCCPTLFTDMESYFADVKMCMIDWSVMPAYSATLAVLVVFPTLCSVGYTYVVIFQKLRALDDQEQEVRTVLEMDTSILMVFFVFVVFCMSWIPWFALRMYETVRQNDAQPGALHFSLVWLGVGQGCWKILIYITMNPEFRRGMRSTCAHVLCCCRLGSPRHSQYIDLQQQRQRYL